MDAVELVAVDNAVVSPGQASREELVGIGMLDMTGPFDHHLSRRLHGLAREHRIPAVRDLHEHYRADAGELADFPSYRVQPEPLHRTVVERSEG